MEWGESNGTFLFVLIPFLAPLKGSATSTMGEVQTLTSQLQNQQCSVSITDTGPSTAFAAIAPDQGGGDPQSANAVVGGQIAPEFSATSLAVCLTGM